MLLFARSIDNCVIEQIQKIYGAMRKREGQNNKIAIKKLHRQSTHDYYYKLIDVRNEKLLRTHYK